MNPYAKMSDLDDGDKIFEFRPILPKNYDPKDGHMGT